jgi:hypothetical protein
MSWLGAVNVTGGGGKSYQLYVFDDGLVVVRPSIARALPGALIGEGLGAPLGGALSGAIGGGIDSVVDTGQLGKHGAKVHALGPTANAREAAKVLPRAILFPLEDIVTGRLSNSKLHIETKKRRMITGFTRSLGGRLATNDLETARRLFARALGPRWKTGSG